MMDPRIGQHFRQEEHPFVALALDWIRNVADKQQQIITPFLNPRQVYVLQQLLAQQTALHAVFCGGVKTAEQQRAWLAPDYVPIEEAGDCRIVAFQITYATKFHRLAHRDILGSLMGIGLKRSAFGDIINEGNQWFFMADEQIASFVQTQITRMGTVPVRLQEVPLHSVPEPHSAWRTCQEVVASLRLDAVVAQAFHLSRQQAKEAVTSGRVKHNWVTVVKADHEVGEQDIISVRGLGRLRIDALLGHSKRDKHIVRMSLVKNK